LELPVKFRFGYSEASAKMAKRKKVVKRAKKPLDSFSAKGHRGRPGVSRSEVKARGDSYRIMFGNIWKDARGPLLKAQTEEDILRAFGAWTGVRKEIEAIADLVLKVLQDPRFPKRRQAQINFLADSLAGRGLVSPRRSRDIRQQDRDKKFHYIIRQDYYIECTCRYKGPALHGRCPKCGTGEVSLPPPSFLSSGSQIF
jgi:hypothetical protein